MATDAMQDPALIHDFLAESEELLQGMDRDMVLLESQHDDEEVLNRIFRALHTIKGTSSFLGFVPIVRVSHRAEDVLNGLRRQEILLTRRIMDALLAARDQLGQMLAHLREGGLREYALVPLLRELEACQSTGAGLPRIGELMVACGVITAEALHHLLEEQDTAEDGRFGKIGDLAVAKGLTTKERVDEVLALQHRLRQARVDLRNLELGGEDPGQVAGLARRENADREASAATVRVRACKLDELMDLVGELVLERNRLVQLSRDLSAARITPETLKSLLSENATRLSFLTDELQAAGLRTRMVPMHTVFRRFPRMVRDIAKTLSKRVHLDVAGEETELDRTMVELVADPLVHLVRNALDHGLETPEDRVHAGKPAEGTLRLEARQESDQIVISLSDDGAGIDPERIAQKALSKGLVTPERLRNLSSQEILEFVFLPGFSTAAQVSDLSGRGVGLDVVRTNLKKMNGAVELTSTPGQGTRVRLRLPLTLAILPVLLVRVAGDTYALPLHVVLETGRVQLSEIYSLDRGEVLHRRNQTIPLLRLADLLEPGSCRSASPHIVILRVAHKQVALLVDGFLGQESTVIKPLSSMFQQNPLVAGATITAEGHVRVVLDPAGLISLGESNLRSRGVCA